MLDVFNVYFIIFFIILTYTESLEITQTLAVHP